MDLLPAYSATASVVARPHAGRLTPLPDHLLLAILSHLPSWDLCTGVRLSCHRLSHVAAALLRERHLATYAALVRLPYTSSPLGLHVDGSSHAEVKALDRLAIACSLTARLSDESDLHLLAEQAREVDADRPSWIDDIFGRLQPSLRITDLVIAQLSTSQEGLGTRLGLRDAAITLPKQSTSSSRGSVKKEVTVVRREKGETLERTAERLVDAYLDLYPAFALRKPLDSTSESKESSQPQLQPSTLPLQPHPPAVSTSRLSRWGKALQSRMDNM